MVDINRWYCCFQNGALLHLLQENECVELLLTTCEPLPSSLNLPGKQTALVGRLLLYGVKMWVVNGEKSFEPLVMKSDIATIYHFTPYEEKVVVEVKWEDLHPAFMYERIEIYYHTFEWRDGFYKEWKSSLK